ncbi:MAG: hypothetical protein GTO30_08540, partial [Acidobacteria bacterium]|nr:hypothetical protein [Acidobacteriota bacterium]NIQ84679.1 hypothetical protein [Acidobacteriota bacterium]
MKQNEWLMLALAVGGVAIIASRLSDIERGAGEFGRGLGRIFGDIRAPRPQPTAADDPSPPESLLVSRSTHRGIQILVFVDPIDLTFE